MALTLQDTITQHGFSHVSLRSEFTSIQAQMFEQSQPFETSLEKLHTQQMQDMAKATGDCSHQSDLKTHQLTLMHAIDMATATGNLEQAHGKTYQQLISEHHSELTQARQQSGADEEKVTLKSKLA